MKKITALLLVLAMVFAFAACGSSEPDDPNCGTYTCTSVEMMGISLSPDEVFESECTMELKNGGKATVNLEGESGSAEWAVNGTELKITIEGVESVGTIENGVIVIDLMDLGMNYTFERSE